MVASIVTSASALPEISKFGSIVSCEWSEGDHSQIYIDHSDGIELAMNHL